MVKIIANKHLIPLYLELFIKTLFEGLGGYGPVFLLKLLSYLRKSHNLYRLSAKKLVKRGTEYYAATALPPCRAPAFRRQMIEEVMNSDGNKPRVKLPGGRPRLLFALFSVSSRCPYHCAYCYAQDDLGPEEQVPLETLVAAFHTLSSEYQVKNFFLTGGEVMCRKVELQQLVEAGRGDIESLWLVSSGYKLDIHVYQELLPYHLKGIVISLDSDRTETVNRQKGHPGAFAYAVQAIKDAEQAGLIVSIDCLVQDELLIRTNFLNYYTFLKDLHVHFVNFFLPIAAGALKDRPITGQPLSGLHRLEKLLQEINTDSQYEDYPIAYSATITEQKLGCRAGRQFIYLDPKGNVRLCPFIAASAGNIKELSLSNIMTRLGQKPGKGACYEQLSAL